MFFVFSFPSFHFPPGADMPSRRLKEDCRDSRSFFPSSLSLSLSIFLSRLGTKKKGGYDLKGLSDSVADSMRGLLSLPSLDNFDKGMLADEPANKIKAAVAEARRIHGL